MNLRIAKVEWYYNTTFKRWQIWAHLVQENGEDWGLEPVMRCMSIECGRDPVTKYKRHEKGCWWDLIGEFLARM